ncbi:glycosyltransferase family 2 protein [Desemzia sp. C1]|uniref:glycosyltransferase family 2 protein n=1 Tax=Desemzia sp. C1 TaxID=2892016 RepID=UPI001E4D5CDA|nr:glycosyltransferase family 2 protein [Desemzia sp. C1]MCI3027637.1 glycosyltransferase family 2 protein [Desemzia sp. C1]
MCGKLISINCRFLLDVNSADIEYLFINDGSKDNTLNLLRKLASMNEQVRYTSFSRNFGKEAAIFAGLEKAAGNYVVVMDADLQDPPDLLPKMYDIIKTETYDCVGTRRVTRKGEPIIRSFFAKQFYKIINRISDVEIVDGARDYRLMSRQMVDAVLEMKEYNRFSKGIFSWVGFDTKYLEYENKNRAAGETTWSFWGLMKYSLDGIVAFSDAPLSLSSLIGLFSFVASIVIAVVVAVRTLIFDDPTSGWTSLVVIILGLGGLQLFCLGILGKYIGKMFLESKNRPIYVIKETEQDTVKKI